jgi:hypothetical protein
MNPRPLLQLEGTAVLAVSVFAYYSDHGSWGLFALLFLMPDVSMVGYLANARARRHARRRRQPASIRCRRRATSPSLRWCLHNGRFPLRYR